MRIAMWSGPRNLSTAMMYAFAARGDCAVMDEPFYAAYLARTGIDHPMRDAILAAQPTDAETVVKALTGPIPSGNAHLYQKHMCHHMVPGIPRDWMAEVVNVFLIRHPARVIASYVAKRENPTLDDLGFHQQIELFHAVRAMTGRAVVIDSADIRADPVTALQRLCDAISLPYTPAMLRWPRGGHPDDGVWAAHWYGAVHASTGFADPEGPLPEVAPAQRPLLDAVLPVYEEMARSALRVGQVTPDGTIRPVR